MKLYQITDISNAFLIVLFAPMKESLNITGVEWNDFMKRFGQLETKLNQALTERRKSLWIKEKEAMEMIGCGITKLRELRLKGIIKSKHNGSNRNYQLLRESVETYMLDNSTVNI